MHTPRTVEPRPANGKALATPPDRPLRQNPKQRARDGLIALVTNIERAQASVDHVLQDIEQISYDYHGSDALRDAIELLRDLDLWRDLVAELRALDDELEDLWEHARDLA